MTLIVSDSSAIKSKPYELEVYKAQVDFPTVQIAYPSRSTIEYGLTVNLQGTVKDSACSTSSNTRNRLILNWEVAVFTKDEYGLELDGENVTKAGLTCPCLKGRGRGGESNTPALQRTHSSFSDCAFVYLSVPHIGCPAPTQEPSLSRRRCEAGLCTDSLSQRTLRVVPRSEGMALYFVFWKRVDIWTSIMRQGL